ncbi:MAG: winged helix-turn-helix domain-containing tetratricopeptide repeat protein [Gemmobacter sp.]
MEIFEFDGFTLDPVAMNLHNRQEELRLRPKSFELLTILLRNRGRVQTKDELLAAVWPDVTVSEESLAQCVTDIRRTLGPAAERLIRTVPGRGYMVDDARVRITRRAPRADTSEPQLPARPMITVPPFADLSRDGSNAWFARGMAEEIMIALSRIREIIVVTPGPDAPATQGDTPHPRGNLYALEGTIRVQGDKLRVTARLIDTGIGNHVWSERFDADLDDIFSVQDEITRQVALSVQVRLADGLSAQLWEGQTRSLKAWEKMVEGRYLFLRFNRTDVLRAAESLVAAIEIDPTYTAAMVLLGQLYWWHARFDLSVDMETSLCRAEEMVAKARGIHPESAIPFGTEALIAFLRDRHSDAIRLSRTALAWAPGDSNAAGICSLVSNFAGDHEDAVTMARHAMRLSPQYSAWLTYFLALSNLWLGNLDAGNRLAEDYMQREPGDPYAYVLLALAAGLAGDEPRARATVLDLSNRFPAFSIRHLDRSEHYAEPATKQRLLRLMREAGLRE